MSHSPDIANLDPEECAKRRRRFLFLAGAFLLPLVWFAVLRICSVCNGENSLDAFYHSRIAELGPGIFLSNTFPALQLSIWCDAFADKELLYHVLLWFLSLIRRMCGIALEPPFHFAAIPVFAMLCWSFVFTARRFGIRARTVFCGSLLAFTLTVNELSRLEMLRPHVLSVALILLAFAVLAKGSFRSRLILISVLSFFYAWSYSNPHFIILPPLIFACFAWKDESWKVFLLPAAALVSVALGLLLHPQAPNTLLIWKVQSLDALISPLTAATDPNRIPAELLPISGKDLVNAVPLFVLAFMNLILIVRFCEFRGFRKISVPALSAAVFGLLFTVAFIWAKRSVEYAAPFTVLGFLALFDSAAREDVPYPNLKKFWKTAVLGIFLISLPLAGINSYQFYTNIHGREFKPKPGLQKYLAEHFSRNETLLNVDWSDFPQLFYTAPQLRWQWGLDPAFSMAKNPRKTKLLTATVSAKRVYAETGVRYAVLLQPRRSRANHMIRCGWQLVAEIPGEAWIFSAVPVENAEP